MAGHVFISYSRNDYEYVQRLVHHLVGSGVPIWADFGISYGQRWVDTVRLKLDDAVAVVAVMTPAASHSEWVNLELSHARELGKPVLPLLLAGRVFLVLASLQHEDVTGGRMPGARFVERLRSLVAADATQSESP